MRLWMKLSAKNLSFSFALFLISLLGWSGVAYGLETTRLSISPVTFELSANPGDVLTNQIKVSNLSDGALQLEVKVENIAGTTDQGQVQLTEEETHFSLSSWVKADPPSFTLGAKESRVITYSITVPHNAEPGGHYGSILVGTVASDSLNSTGASTVQRIGSLLLVRVSGQSKEDLVVKRFNVHSFTEQTSEITSADGKTKVLIPKVKPDLPQTSQSYIDKGPILFNILTHNNGNVHVKPIGFITIRNIFHQKVATLPIDQRNVFPDMDREVSVVWPRQSLWGMYYTAELGALYGSLNQTVNAEISFWAFPKVAAIAIGIALLLLLLLRKRITRAFRVLIKGD